jgi:hypothetical protein
MDENGVPLCALYVAHLQPFFFSVWLRLPPVSPTCKKNVQEAAQQHNRRWMDGTEHLVSTKNHEGMNRHDYRESWKSTERLVESVRAKYRDGLSWYLAGVSTK